MPGSSPGTTSVCLRRHLDSRQPYVLAARCARGLHLSLAPNKGVGNAGCPLHPRSRVHVVLVRSTRVTTSTPESPGIPARNGFNSYLELSPVTGLFATVVCELTFCLHPVGPTQHPQT